MNTKYPLNGRYATLGDIIHEYAKYSTWPDDIELSGYKTDGYLPFITVLYNSNPKLDKPVMPYDVVWFPNIYSTTEKDIELKRMKIVQEEDYTNYGFDRPIKAEEVKDPSAYFPFRFIPASKSKKPSEAEAWYYNYKTSEGESVIMYALRKIIDIDKEFNINKAYQLFFGNSISYAHITPLESGEQQYIIYDDGIIIKDGDDIEGTIPDESQMEEYKVYNTILTPKFGNDMYIDSGFSTPTKLTSYPYNNKMLHQTTKMTPPAQYWDPNTKKFKGSYKKLIYGTGDEQVTNFQPWAENFDKTDVYNINFSLFNSIDPSIFEITGSNVSIKNTAYELLGSNVWTIENVQYTNYTDSISPQIKNTVFNDLSTVQKTISVIKSPEQADKTYTFKGNLNMLAETIYYIYRDLLDTVNASSGNLNTDDSESETFYNDMIYRDHIKNLDNDIKKKNIFFKVLYYSVMFLNSQRFYVSYVNAFRFIKISQKSYAQNEPILRCDLGIIQIIEYFKVINAIHLKESALTQGKLSESTPLKIRLTYLIKYKNIPETLIPDTHDITITFKDIMNATKKEDEINVNESFSWFRLVAIPFITENYNYEGQFNSTEVTENYKYSDDGLFKTIFYTKDGIQFGVTDGSLGTLEWPLNDSKLNLGNKQQLENSINNPDYGVADTYDINTFKSYGDDTEFGATEMQNIINSSNISPWGILRIHSVYDNSSEESTINSSFYIDVSILRCKNFYYETGQLAADNNSDVHVYYTPVSTYNDNINIPPQELTCLDRTASMIEAGNEQIIFSSNDNVINYNPDLGNINTVYITFKSSTTRYKQYASGAKLMLEDSEEQSEYTNEQELKVWRLNTNTNTFISISNNQNLVKQINSHSLVKQYAINIINDKDDFNNNKSITYRFKFNDVNMYYYFKTVPNYIKPTTGTSTLYITPIPSINFDSETCIEKQMTQNVSMRQTDLKFHFTLYNKANKTSYTKYTSVSFTSTATIEAPNINNLVLQPLGFSAADNTGINSNKYIYNNPPNKLYMILFINNQFDSELKTYNLYDAITFTSAFQGRIYCALNNLYAINIIKQGNISNVLVKSIYINGTKYDIIDNIFSYDGNDGAAEITLKSLYIGSEPLINYFNANVSSTNLSLSINVNDNSYTCNNATTLEDKDYCNLSLKPGINKIIINITKS